METFAILRSWLSGTIKLPAPFVAKSQGARREAWGQGLPTLSRTADVIRKPRYGRICRLCSRRFRVGAIIAQLARIYQGGIMRKILAILAFAYATTRLHRHSPAKLRICGGCRQNQDGVSTLSCSTGQYLLRSSCTTAIRIQSGIPLNLATREPCVVWRLVCNDGTLVRWPFPADSDYSPGGSNDLLAGPPQSSKSDVHR